MNDEWATVMLRLLKSSRSKVVELAVSLKAEGKDTVEIADALNARGFLTIRGLRHSQLSVWGLLREHEAKMRKLQ